MELASVNNNDPYFYGDKYVKYPDGSLHLHVELVAEVIDSFPHQTADRKSAPVLNVPGSVNVPSRDDESSYMDITIGSKSVGSKKSSKSMKSGKSLHSSKSSPVILGGYDGSASRSGRSIKSRKSSSGVKRTPRTQDDHEDAVVNVNNGGDDVSL